MDKKIERIMQIIIIALIIIPAASSAQLPLLPRWSTYENEEHGFSIDYPADWEKRYSYGMGDTTTVNFIEPHGYAAAGVSVSSTPGINSDEFIESFRNKLSQRGISPIDEGSIIKNSLKGYYLSYREYNSMHRLVVFVYNGKVYLIGCTSELNYYYDYYAEVFDDMVESFEIVSKTPTPVPTSIPTPIAPIQTPTHTPAITSTPHTAKITPPPTVTPTPGDNILYNPYVLGAVISAVIIAISSIIGAWISSRRRS